MFYLQSLKVDPSSPPRARPSYLVCFPTITLTAALNNNNNNKGSNNDNDDNYDDDIDNNFGHDFDFDYECGYSEMLPFSNFKCFSLSYL